MSRQNLPNAAARGRDTFLQRKKYDLCPGGPGGHIGIWQKRPPRRDALGHDISEKPTIGGPAGGGVASGFSATKNDARPRAAPECHVRICQTRRRAAGTRFCNEKNTICAPAGRVATSEYGKNGPPAGTPSDTIFQKNRRLAARREGVSRRDLARQKMTPGRARPRNVTSEFAKRGGARPGHVFATKKIRFVSRRVGILQKRPPRRDALGHDISE